MQFTLTHPRLQGLRGWSLRTRDAHGLYAQFGFKPLEHPASSMALRFPDVYRRAGQLPQANQQNLRRGPGPEA